MRGPVGCSIWSRGNRSGLCLSMDVCVGESRVFGDEVDDVHAVAAGAAVEPEVHHVVHGRSHLRILPIEVRLFGGEEREKILVGGGVVGPGAVGVAEDHGPVVRRESGSPVEERFGFFQMYQSRLGESRDFRDSRNHACWEGRSKYARHIWHGAGGGCGRPYFV